MLSRIPFRSAICAVLLSVSANAAPVIDPIPSASVPAGKSLTIPITATSSNGRPLAYTITSSTNRITVEVHTNNPFWKMSVVQVAASNAPGAFQTPFRGGIATVTNIGDMTLMLFKDRAPRSVDAFMGFSCAGFYSSNTIFHRVIPGFMIQGGCPLTNGTGGPIFRYDDEFHPRSLFTGNGQLALANSGKDTDGSQFFITLGPQRFLDFGYTLFGQLLRGFSVVTNIINTPSSADRPLADVIITRASLVTNMTDMVITLTGTNLVGVSGTIQVIADDGLAGGRVTNSFTATTVADASNSQAFLKTPAITNLFLTAGIRHTNQVQAQDLDGEAIVYSAGYVDAVTFNNATNGNIYTNGTLAFTIVPGYVGPLKFKVYAGSDEQIVTFAVGDTALSATPSNFSVRPLVSFTNQILATFTNGVPNSPTGNFTAVINWGDNSVDAGVIVTNVTGRKEVRGTHTYTNSGIYPIYVTIKSVAGAETNVVSVATVQPSLSLTRTGTNTILRWPSWAADFVAQSQTNLATTNWVSLTNDSYLIGYENVTTNGSSATNRFYRLRR